MYRRVTVSPVPPPSFVFYYSCTLKCSSAQPAYPNPQRSLQREKYWLLHHVQITFQPFRVLCNCQVHWNPDTSSCNLHVTLAACTWLSECTRLFVVAHGHPEMGGTTEGCAAACVSSCWDAVTGMAPAWEASGGFCRPEQQMQIRSNPAVPLSWELQVSPWQCLARVLALHSLLRWLQPVPCIALTWQPWEAVALLPMHCTQALWEKSVWGADTAP